MFENSNTQPSSVSYEDYESWRRGQGVGVKGGAGVKRKLHKVPKGVFTAAGKHPIGALKEKIPTCEFTEVSPFSISPIVILWRIIYLLCRELSTYSEI